MTKTNSIAFSKGVRPSTAVKTNTSLKKHHFYVKKNAASTLAKVKDAHAQDLAKGRMKRVELQKKLLKKTEQANLLEVRKHLVEEKLEKKKVEARDTATVLTSVKEENDKLKKLLTESENARSKFKDELGHLKEENKRLEEVNGKLEAKVKKIATIVESP